MGKKRSAKRLKREALKEKNAKKSEIGILSSLAFSIFGALICTMLFTGEARVFGQLVSVAIGGAGASAEWWKSQPNQVHYSLIVMMVLITICAAIRYQIVVMFRKVKYSFI